MTKKKQKLALKPVLLKTGGLVLLIVVPLIAVVAIFTPIIHSNKPLDVSTYRIPQQFTQEDIDTLIGLMKAEPEFGFYFELLDDNSITEAGRDVFNSLNGHRSADQILAQIESSQKKVRGLALFFSSFDLAEEESLKEFFSPEIKRAVWLFFFEDFKLTVKALVYQKLYQPDFQLQWDKETRTVAANLVEFISSLNESQRANLTISR